MKKKIDGIRGGIAALEREALREEKEVVREKSRSMRRKFKKVTKAGYRANARAINMVMCARESLPYKYRCARKGK